MLTVAPTLDDDRPRLRGVEIDQRHRRPRIGQLRDERRHVFRHAGAPPDRIEVAETRVEQPAFATRHRARPTSTAPASRSTTGLSSSMLSASRFSGGVVCARIAATRFWISPRSRCSASSGYDALLPLQEFDPRVAADPLEVRAASATSTRPPALRRSTATHASRTSHRRRTSSGIAVRPFDHARVRVHGVDHRAPGVDIFLIAAHQQRRC